MIAVLGEVMIELSAAGAGLLRPGVAGDTYNTAVMLSRLGAKVAYATALGDEQFSAQIRQAMAQQGLTDNAVLSLTGQQPGLYCISNSADGERSFSYWRQHSAARQTFQSIALFQQLLQSIQHCTDVYWSGITLSLMSEAVLSSWLEYLLQLQQRGGQVYFDTNYRAALWQGRIDLLQCYQAAMQHCNYFLPSLEDCHCIWGSDTPAQALELLQRLLSTATVSSFTNSSFTDKPVICLTAQQQLCWLDGSGYQQFSLQFSPQMVDATGAGDAFSGALIAALQQALPIAQAVNIAHKAASTVVQQQGAILSEATWPELLAQLKSLGLYSSHGCTGAPMHDMTKHGKIT